MKHYGGLTTQALGSAAETLAGALEIRLDKNRTNASEGF
jgi:hypothetical protein